MKSRSIYTDTKQQELAEHLKDDFPLSVDRRHVAEKMGGSALQTLFSAPLFCSSEKIYFVATGEYIGCQLLKLFACKRIVAGTLYLFGFGVVEIQTVFGNKNHLIGVIEIHPQ